MTARDDEPAPLAEGARRIVNAARPFERLPPDRKARVRGRVMAAVAAGVAVSAVATEAAAAGASAAAGAGAGVTTAVEAGAGAGGALGSAGLGAATKAAGVSLFAKIGLSVALVTAGAGGWLWNRAQQEPSPSPARPVATLAAGPSASPGVSPERAAGDTGEPVPGAASAPAADRSASAAAGSNTNSGFPAVTATATLPGAGAERPQAAVDPAASSTAVDSLQEETRLLAAAHAALSRGDAASALVLIDEHAARFPSGVLAPERRAARAMALCKQGRAADGQREADALYGEGSKSPVAEKIRRACAK